jgi:hypothetical protein
MSWSISAEVFAARRRFWSFVAGNQEEEELACSVAMSSQLDERDEDEETGSRMVEILRKNQVLEKFDRMWAGLEVWRHEN